MVATQERTATFLDRVGHMTPQGVLPTPEFDYLVGAIVEAEPLESPRDYAIKSIFDAFQQEADDDLFVDDDDKVVDGGSIMYDIMRSAYEQTVIDHRNGIKKPTLIFSKWDLAIFTSPRKERVDVRIDSLKKGFGIISIDANSSTTWYIDEGFYRTDRQEVEQLPDSFSPEALTFPENLSIVRELDKEIFKPIVLGVRN